MMARISSVGADAFSRTDRISNNLSSVMMRDSRMDMLLGLASSQPQKVSPDYNCPGNGNELDEEEIWDTAENSRSWADETMSPAAATIHHEVRKIDLASYANSFSNGRRWLGLEKDPGLSVAYAEAGGRTRGGGVGLSPLNRSSAANGGGGGGRDSRTPSRLIPNREAKPSHYAQVVSSVVENSKVLHQSAPVNVPDWSKILGTKTSTTAAAMDYADDMAGVDNDDDDERLPPHEYLQREYARSQVNTFSMCEGAGRTLKGRDLSRVRNAVLRQTGFLGE
ncbi:hypothetical protein R1flu_007307 [Riccia fluitans]|uniref:Senescence regulator n=1 Tax=Riccia fluitans TaxID=41844 RepID=A0ABD1YZA4_9MARC